MCHRQLGRALVRAAVWVALAGVAGCAAGCGSSKESSPGPNPVVDDAAPVPEERLLPALPLMPMGAVSLRDYAYSVGPGRAAFTKALAIHRTSDPKDWAAIAEHCQRALAADPKHLEAHWYLGLALARQGRHDQVASHLSTAIAGDFLRWGERSLSIKSLTGFYETDPGRQFRDLVARYGQRFREQAASSVLLVGRRGKPWYPQRAGAGSLNHRAEIYGHTPDGGRYLRLSRTNGSMAGFLMAPTGTELAYVSYRAVWTPPAPESPESEAPESDAPTEGRSDTSDAPQPHIRKLTIGTIDLERATMSERDIDLSGVAELWLSYGRRAGKRARLVARVRSPRPSGPSRPSGGAPTELATIRTYRLDMARGRAALETVNRGPSDGPEEPADPAPSSAEQVSDYRPPPLRGDVLRVAYDRVERLRLPIDGVLADWDENGAAGSFRLEPTRTTVTLADGALALGHTLSWSPSRTRLAFAQMVEPSPEDCERGTLSAPTPLYIIEAATGARRQVAAAVGLQAPVWLDERRIAYTDPSGRDSAVYIVDVESEQSAARLTALGGVGTRYLPGRPFPLPGCDPP